MSNSSLNALKLHLDLMNAHATAKVFAAAEELGVFAALETGQHTVEQLAEACNANAPALSDLLDALIAIGVVERYGEDYALAHVMRLTPREHRDLGEQSWSNLAHYLRTGDRGQAGELKYAADTASAQWMLTPMAMAAATALDIGNTRRDLNILELGAATGVWCLTFAHRDPGARVTVIDWPEALVALRQTAEDLGVSDRVETIAADPRTEPLPAETYDLAILAGVLHKGEEQENVELLRSVRQSLKAEGEIAIIDIFPGQESGDVTRAMNALKLALGATAGRHYLPQEVQQALLDAGFQKPQYTHLPEPPYTQGLMLAAK